MRCCPALHRCRYDEDRGGTIDASELEKIFEDFGKSLSKDEIEELIDEYGGSDPDGITFPEFVSMNEALPPSFEVPCVFRAVRDYLDEVRVSIRVRLCSVRL